ncbi:hypothetical protein RTZ71_28775 [Rhodococcus qingshengii]|nr:hypothetical protein [Rhodococcus qingshengii]MDT9664714.1 hypothetical protein [Rhodococcus qingshengii]
MIGLARSVGLSARWLVIDAPSSFFDITKRVDNAVSGIAVTAGSSEQKKRGCTRMYPVRSAQSWRVIFPGDCVMLHDPQTAGLCEGLHELGRPWCGARTTDPTNATHTPSVRGDSLLRICALRMVSLRRWTRSARP